MVSPASPTPPSPEPKKGSWKNFKGRFLILSILFHVLLIAGATYLVVQTFAPRKQTFQPGPKAAANKAVEHKINMAKKQNAMSAPASKRITTSGLSKVVLPEMPAMPSVNPSTATMGSMGVAGAGLFGGGEKGGAGGGGIPLFGLRDSRGSALEGTFYDLKQTRARKPNPKWNEKGYRAFVANFAGRNLSESALASYYRGKDKLYAPQIMMPSIPADAGPKGFGVDKEVAPSYWLVVYKAKVSPPRSGVIHFVGASDDVMLVKFQGRLVLDGSLYHGLGEWKAKTEYPYDNYVRDTYLKGKGGGWARSDGIKVEAGQWYDLVVAIGEAPGGFFDASLLIEEEGVTYEKDAKGSPILPPFRLSNVEVAPADKARSLPPFAKNGPIWKSQAPAGGRPGSLPGN